MKNTSERYNWLGMLIVSILMVIGFIVIYFTWGNMAINWKNIYNYFYKNGVVFIFSSFFIGVGIYCWFLFFNDVIINPKEDILFLKNINGRFYEFIDKKGKIIEFINTNKNKYNVGNYYKVLRAKNTIKKIIEESNDKFIIPKEKRSYWLNFYSPIGNFEDIFLLPIVYVAFIIFFTSCLTTVGLNKIYFIICMIMPLFLIIYDAIYKIKLNDVLNTSNKNSDVDLEMELETLQIKFKNIILSFIRICKIVIALVIVGFMLWVFIKAADNITRFVAIPFLVCVLAMLGQTIIGEKYSKIFEKIYMFSFLSYWFGFLCFWCYYAIKDKEIGMLLFSIPFWTVGIFMLYKIIKK